MRACHEEDPTLLRHPSAYQPPTKEDLMKNDRHPDLGEKAKWAMGAVGIVLTYFGLFALLLYPVVQASAPMA
jgi:hypothetical protein